MNYVRYAAELRLMLGRQAQLTELLRGDNGAEVVGRSLRMLKRFVRAWEDVTESVELPAPRRSDLDDEGDDASALRHRTPRPEQ